MTAIVRVPSAVAPGMLVLGLGLTVAFLSVPPDLAVVGVVALVAGAAAVVWSITNLESFVLAPLLAAAILPAALITPAGAQVAAGDLLLVAALGGWLVRAAAGAGPTVRVRGNRLLAPALLYAAITLASLAWSVSQPDTVKAVVQIAEIVVVIPLLFASVPASLQAIRSGLLFYIGAACVLAAVVLGHFLPRAAGGDVSAVFLAGLHKNAIGSVLGAGLALAYGLWLTEPRGRTRRVLALASVVLFGGLCASISEGALLGALVAVLAASLLLRRRRLVTGALASAAVVFFLVAIDAQVPPADEAAGGYESSEVRGYSFGNAVEKIQADPLLGTGAGTYWDHITELDIGLADPNNVFLLTWAELGIAGIAALVFLLYRFARLWLGARRLNPAAAAPAVVSGAAAVSLLVHFQVDSTWTRGTATLCFALFGVLLAAVRLAPPRWTPAATPASPTALLASPVAPPSWAARAASPAVAAGGTPLSVLHVVSSDAFAGIERHVVALARELRKRGCAAEIACPPSATRLRAEAEATMVPVHPRRARTRGGWLGAVARKLATAPPDVVHLHDGRSAVAGTLLAAPTSALVVRSQHFVRPASVERTGWRGPASLALHRTLNRGVDGYVAVSRSVADAALERRDTRGAEVVVIPPGIELPADSIVEAACARRAARPDPVVAVIGRLEAEKGVATLVRALPRLLALVPSCRFVVAGTGAVGPELRRLAGELGVDHAITWLGEVAGAASVLEGAHVYVNSSPAEGFGLATVEAMALAVPVVAIGAGASAEIVEHEFTGLLVPPDDPTAMADAIATLAVERERAEQMGRNGRARAQSLYGVEHAAELALDFYSRLCDQARR